MRTFGFYTKWGGYDYLFDSSIRKSFVLFSDPYTHSVANNGFGYENDVATFFCDAIIVWKSNVDYIYCYGFLTVHDLPDHVTKFSLGFIGNETEKVVPPDFLQSSGVSQWGQREIFPGQRSWSLGI